MPTESRLHWARAAPAFLEEDALYDRFDRTKAWDDPANVDVSNAMVRLFAPDESGDNGTSCIGIVAQYSLTGKGRKRARLDGMSNTIMVLVKGTEGVAAPNDHADQFGSGAIGAKHRPLQPAQASGRGPGRICRWHGPPT
jgi:hypothetical protein